MKLSFDKFLFGFSGYQLRQEGKYFYLIQVKLFEKIVFLSKKKVFYGCRQSSFCGKVFFNLKAIKFLKTLQKFIF